MPSVRLTRRRLLLSIAFVVAVVAFMYLGLPKLVGLGATWRRLSQGNGWWLAAAALLEVISFGGYIALFRAVFVHGTQRIGWAASYQITLAGLVATRLFAAGGAGGIALTIWALRRAGMDARTVASRMVTFNVLLYAVYMLSLVIGGLGLYFGVFAGPGPFAITVVPAIFGGSVILVVLAISLLPGDAERLVAEGTRRTNHPRLSAILRRLATVPAAAASGIRTAISIVVGGDPNVLGALASWGFDIATLWACFHAFGASPPVAVIVTAYFVGWLANLLPLPGGVGGVEGGMIGAFSAFGVSVQTAIVAVLAYRAFSFWAPMLPGGVAYLQLRHTVSRWRDTDEHEAVPVAQTPSYTL